MKKFLLLLLLLGASLQAASITACDLCDFLNQNAAADPLHFYDAKMTVVAEGPCLLRAGAVGSYRYQAEGANQATGCRLQAAGAEKKLSAPLFFLSYNDALQYCAWKNKNAAQFFSPKSSASSLSSSLRDEIDSDLKSNLISWQLIDAASPCHAASGVGAAAATELDTIFEETVGVLGIVGGVAGARSEGLRDEMASSAGERIAPGFQSTPTSSEKERNSSEFTFSAQEQQHVTEALQAFTKRPGSDFNGGTIEALQTQQEELWKKYSMTCQGDLVSKILLERAEKNWDEVQEKTTPEALEKNYLGSFAQGAKKAEGVMSSASKAVPPLMVVLGPLSQLAAVSGKAAEETNKLWAERAKRRAEKYKASAQESFNEEGKNLAQGQETLLKFREELKKHEELAFSLERLHNSVLTAHFLPQQTWDEQKWAEWSAAILGQTEEQSSSKITSLAAKAPHNSTWIAEQIGKAWETRVNESRTYLYKIKHELNKRLAPREQENAQLLENIDRMQAELETFLEQESSLNQAAIKLKGAIAEENEKIGQRIKVSQAEHEKKLENLEKIEQTLKALAKEKQNADTALNAAREKLEKSNLSDHQEKYQRLLKGAEKRFQADQESLRNIWPELDLSFQPYLKWELLFPKDFEREEMASPAIAAPEQLQEDLEKKGKFYFYQAERALQEASSEKNPAASLEENVPITKPTLAEPTPHFKNSAEDPTQELLVWSQNQVNDPTELDRTRWDARRALELAEKERRKMASLRLQLRNEKLPEETKTSLGSALEEFQELYSEKASSFGGANTAIGTVIAEPVSVQLQKLNEFFRSIETTIRNAKTRWWDAVQKSELLRKQRVEVDLPNVEEAWKSADQAVLLALEKQNLIRAEKEAFQRLAKNWEKNTARWRLLKQIEDLEQKLKQKQSDQDWIIASGEQTEKLGKEVEALRTSLEEAKQTWQKLVQEYREEKSKKKSSASFNALSLSEEEKQRQEDAAVLSRWEQFADRQKKEQENDALFQAGSARLHQQQLNNDLRQKEKILFTEITAGTVKKHVSDLKMQALADARNNRPGIEEIWASEDPKIFKIFKKEKTRLDRIEKIWEAIVRAKDEFVQKAAKRYHAGQPWSWGHELTESERQRYNEEIARKNSEYRTSFNEQDETF